MYKWIFSTDILLIIDFRYPVLFTSIIILNEIFIVISFYDVINFFFAFVSPIYALSETYHSLETSIGRPTLEKHLMFILE